MISLTSGETIILKALLRTHVPGAEVWILGTTASQDPNTFRPLDVVLRNPSSLDTPQTDLDALRKALQKSTLSSQIFLHDWSQLPEDFRREISSSHVVLIPVAHAAV